MKRTTVRTQIRTSGSAYPATNTRYFPQRHGFQHHELLCTHWASVGVHKNVKMGSDVKWNVSRCTLTWTMSNLILLTIPHCCI